MDTDGLRKLARNPRFIPGIYNYCDRWCERCALSHRCLSYAMEQAEDDPDSVGTARDLSDQKFWDKLHRQFRATIEMVRADAKAREIDLDEPKLPAEIATQERAERRCAAKNLPLSRPAMSYARSVEQWFENASLLFKPKGSNSKRWRDWKPGSGSSGAGRTRRSHPVVSTFHLCEAVASDWIARDRRIGNG
jgi:hypothetical protein